MASVKKEEATSTAKTETDKEVDIAKLFPKDYANPKPFTSTEELKEYHTAWRKKRRRFEATRKDIIESQEVVDFIAIQDVGINISQGIIHCIDQALRLHHGQSLHKHIGRLAGTNSKGFDGAVYEERLAKKREAEKNLFRCPECNKGLKLARGLRGWLAQHYQYKHPDATMPDLKPLLAAKFPKKPKPPPPPRKKEKPPKSPKPEKRTGSVDDASRQSRKRKHKGDGEGASGNGSKGDGGAKSTGNDTDAASPTKRSKKSRKKAKSESAGNGDGGASKNSSRRSKSKSQADRSERDDGRPRRDRAISDQNESIMQMLRERLSESEELRPNGAKDAAQGDHRGNLPASSETVPPAFSATYPRGGGDRGRYPPPQQQPQQQPGGQLASLPHTQAPRPGQPHPGHVNYADGNGRRVSYVPGSNHPPPQPPSLGPRSVSVDQYPPGGPPSHHPHHHAHPHPQQQQQVGAGNDPRYGNHALSTNSGGYNGYNDGMVQGNAHPHAVHPSQHRPPPGPMPPQGHQARRGDGYQVPAHHQQRVQQQPPPQQVPPPQPAQYYNGAPAGPRPTQMQDPSQYGHGHPQPPPGIAPRHDVHGQPQHMGQQQQQQHAYMSQPQHPQHMAAPPSHSRGGHQHAPAMPPQQGGHYQHAGQYDPMSHPQARPEYDPRHQYAARPQPSMPVQHHPQTAPPQQAYYAQLPQQVHAAGHPPPHHQQQQQQQYPYQQQPQYPGGQMPRSQWG